MVKFSGFFFDGRTASKVPVDVRLTPQSVLIDAPGKGQKVWPYSEIKLIQTGSRHGPVRLERPVTRYGKECVEAVVIEDPQFLHVAEEVAPGALVSFWKNPKNRNRLRVVVVLALLAIPPFLYGIWTLGLPRLSDAVAERYPRNGRESWGIPF